MAFARIYALTPPASNMDGPWPGCIPGTVLSLSGTPSALTDYNVPIRDKRKSYARYDIYIAIFWESGSRRCATDGLRGVFLFPGSHPLRGLLCASRL